MRVGRSSATSVPVRSGGQASSLGTKSLLAASVALAALCIPHLASAAPARHADGQILFFSEHGGEDEIWVMNADGSHKHSLTRHDGAKITDLDPAWSPDGRKIAYVSDASGSQQVWIMNANGS